MAACIARTASASCGRAGLTSTVPPSVSSAYMAAAGVLTRPPLGWRHDNDRAPRILAAVAAHRSVHQVLHGCRAPFPRRECRPLPSRSRPIGNNQTVTDGSGPSIRSAGPRAGCTPARAVPASRPAGTAVTLDDSRIANPTWVLYGRDWPCRQGPERRGYPHPGARPGAGCCKGISPRHYAGALSCDRCDALTATAPFGHPVAAPDRAAAGRLRPGRAAARQLHRRQLNRAGLRPVPRPPEPGSRWHQHQGSGARRREYRADARPRSRDKASARSTPTLGDHALGLLDHHPAGQGGGQLLVQALGPGA